MGEYYITVKEQEKCRKVQKAFQELFDITDIVVSDAGRYGFIKVKWFKRGIGFDEVRTYWNSEALFEDLWQDWYEYHVLTPVLRTPIAELDYDEILRTYPEKKQKEILSKRDYFQFLCQ